MTNLFNTAKKALAVALVASTFGAGMIVASSEAEARPRRGAAIAAGIIGGIAAGALIAGAARGAYAAPGYGYYDRGYAPAYGGGYRYVNDGYYAAPRRCYTTKQRYWIDEDTIAIRRVRVCD
jgi:hypothetical protein